MRPSRVASLPLRLAPIEQLVGVVLLLLRFVGEATAGATTVSTGTWHHDQARPLVAPSTATRSAASASAPIRILRPFARLNWLEVPSVAAVARQQGHSCGSSCTAFALASVLESKYAIFTRQDVVPVSTAQLVECGSEFLGWDIGAEGVRATQLLLYLNHAEGLVSAAEYPESGFLKKTLLGSFAERNKCRYGGKRRRVVVEGVAAAASTTSPGAGAVDEAGRGRAGGGPTGRGINPNLNNGGGVAPVRAGSKTRSETGTATSMARNYN